MTKPYLLIVTGRPGAGKTTFAQALGREIFMPVVSRDSIKEGYVHTFGKRHSELPEDTNGIATKIFFDTIKGLLDNDVSLIAEAAFQHELWSSMMEPFIDKAQIYLLICRVDDKLALDRFVHRGLNNSLREFFHGDKGVDMARRGMELSVSPYQEPRLPVPTFHIDTSNDYIPTIAQLKEKIFIHI